MIGSAALSLDLLSGASSLAPCPRGFGGGYVENFPKYFLILGEPLPGMYVFS